VTYTGLNIRVKENSIFVDDQEIKVPTESIKSGSIKIQIEGIVENVYSDGAIEATSVKGNVSAGTSVKCGCVGGAVNAGSSVNCGRVGGSVTGQNIRRA
jgi:hypothetical protein